jgi:hypothetical protein
MLQFSNREFDFNLWVILDDTFWIPSQNIIFNGSSADLVQSVLKDGCLVCDQPLLARSKTECEDSLVQGAMTMDDRS